MEQMLGVLDYDKYPRKLMPIQINHKFEIRVPIFAIPVVKLESFFEVFMKILVSGDFLTFDFESQKIPVLQVVNQR